MLHCLELIFLGLLLSLSAVECVRSCSVSYPIGLKGTNGGIEYKAVDIDRNSNIIVGGACSDSTICPGSTTSEFYSLPIFEYIDSATLAFTWTRYMRKVNSNDLDVFDVYSIKASPTTDFFIAALTYSGSSKKLAFVKMPTVQSTPSVSQVIHMDAVTPYFIETDGMHYDGTNIFAALRESSNDFFSLIKIPFTGTPPSYSSLKISQRDSSAKENEKFSITNEGTSYFYLGGLMHDSSSSSRGYGPFFAKI